MEILEIPKPAIFAAVALSFSPVSCNIPSLNSIADSISQQPAQASSRYGAVQPPRGTAYAVDGSLTTTELDTLLGLDFSNGQTYHAMKNALGFPAHRDGNRDYYRMPNAHWFQQHLDIGFTRNENLAIASSSSHLFHTRGDRFSQVAIVQQCLSASQQTQIADDREPLDYL